MTRNARESAKARRLYRSLFDEDLEPDWTFRFGNYGSIDEHTKEIFILSDCVEDSLDTLIHEFLHHRHPEWDHHGRKFKSEIQRLLKKVVKY